MVLGIGWKQNIRVSWTIKYSKNRLILQNELININEQIADSKYYLKTRYSHSREGMCLKSIS